MSRSQPRHRDDFDLMCLKEIALQRDYLTISDSSDIFSDTSEIYSNWGDNFDINQINSAFMYAGKLPSDNVWDIGFKIGSKFTPNSLLYESGNDYMYSSGLPKQKDSNKFALVPAGKNNTNNTYCWNSGEIK